MIRLQKGLLKVAGILNDRPGVASILFAIILGVGGISSLFLQIDDGDKAYLPEGNAVLATDLRLKENFPGDVSIVALLEPAQGILDKKFLLRLDQAASDLKSAPEIGDVFAITQQDHIAATDEGFEVSPLVDPLVVEQKTRQYWMSRIKIDPFGQGTIVDSNLKGTLLVATAASDESAEDHLKAEEVFLGILKKYNLTESLKGVSGVLNSNTARYDVVEKDNLIFVPLIAVGGFIFIYLLFGNWMYVLLTACGIGAALSVVMLVFACFGWPFTTVSSILGPLMSAIVSALFLHFFNGVKLCVEKRQKTYSQAVDEALEHICVPAFFISLTTAAGLSSLVLSEIPTVKHFGIVGAIAVMASFFMILMLIPAPLRAWGERAQGKAFNLLIHFDRTLSFCTGVALRRPAAVCFVSLLSVVLAGVYTSKIKVETSILEFFNDDHLVTKGLEQMERGYYGISSFNLSFEAKSLDRFKDPELLKKIGQIEDWLKKQPGVDRTISMNDFVKQMHKAFNGGSDEFKVIPDSQDLLTQYLFVYDGSDIYDVVNRDFNHSQLSVYTRLYGANEAGVLFANLDQFMTTIDWPEDVKWSTAGFMKILSEQEDFLVDGQLKSLWLAVALIFAFLLALTRSFKNAFVCLIPNLAAPMVMFGVMGLLSIWLNIGTVLVASVIIGIAVDDTIHIFHDFHQRVLGGQRPSWAIARALRETGRALVATTIVLGVEFALLIFSDFGPTSEFGILGLSGVLAALYFDLMLLPSLLLVLYSGTKKGNNQGANEDIISEEKDELQACLSA